MRRFPGCCMECLLWAHWEKMKPAWIPSWELTGAMKDEQQWHLDIRNIFLGWSPGRNPLLILLCWLLTSLWFWDFSCSQSLWCSGKSSGEMSSDVGAGTRCCRARNWVKPLGPCTQMPSFDLLSTRMGYLQCFYPKCCSALQTLRAILIFNIVVSMSLSFPGA